jgi:hypothetical protein
MYQGFDHIRAAIGELEAVVKPGSAGDAARQRAREKSEKLERRARFDRAMRAVCDHKWTA